MILFDFGSFMIMVIAVMIPLGIGIRIGYNWGKKDSKRIKNSYENKRGNRKVVLQK
jgi:Na+-driven multidrug efflux pump